jgi:hypothetical protein
VPPETARLGRHSSKKGGWNRVEQIKLIHQRLVDADVLPALLAAAWDTFELVQTIASASAGDSPDLYPAFTFARGSAINGRNALAVAPSMPPVPADATPTPPEPAADVDRLADALAALASALSRRLRESAELAPDPADRSACQNAARESDQITSLLARGTP